jgi:inorganic triphosphatase YgiF
MSNVAEFIEVRQQIESLAKEIETLIERKTMAESRNRLDRTTELLTKLTAMADNDVQEIAVGRLTRLLTKLATKVAVWENQKRPAKKPPVS